MGQLPPQAGGIYKIDGEEEGRGGGYRRNTHPDSQRHMVNRCRVDGRKRGWGKGCTGAGVMIFPGAW